MTKFSFKIIMIILIYLSSNKILLSQDSIIVREHTGLSSFININNLSNIKQIKQIEHNKIIALDPNFIINFNKDKSVNNFICDSRDTSFIVTFYFNRLNKNYLELSNCYINLPKDYEYSLHPKSLNLDSLKEKKSNEYDTIRGDTSYGVQKYYFYNDTLMTYQPMSDYSDANNNTNDTTFLIFKDNKLYKRIEYHSSYDYQKLKKHTKENISSFFYNENGRLSRVIKNEFGLRYNFKTNKTELLMTETDTVFFFNNEKENIFYSISKTKDLYKNEKNQNKADYSLTKYIYEKDTVLHILYYRTNRKFKSKRLSGEDYVVYNRQGLVVRHKEIMVTHFLGFKQREEYINRTFEYVFWE